MMTTILSAMLLVAIASMVSLTTTTSAAFAQTANNTTTGTTPSSSNASKMMGLIASIQQDENRNPAWITSGWWSLESDAPLVGPSATGNQTEPHITNFTAMIFMVKNGDGRDFHQHKISDFKQESVTHQGANSTTVNGTFTVTLQKGPVNNVRGYMHVINDKIELWVDPVATENHFGPTTITGMQLNAERLRELMTGNEAMMTASMTSATQQ